MTSANEIFISSFIFCYSFLVVQCLCHWCASVLACVCVLVCARLSEFASIYQSVISLLLSFFRAGSTPFQRWLFSLSYHSIKRELPARLLQLFVAIVIWITSSLNIARCYGNRSTSIFLFRIGGFWDGRRVTLFMVFKRFLLLVLMFLNA